MAKGSKGRRSSRLSPYALPSCNHDVSDNSLAQKPSTDKKEWEDATCSVCMECPHNAVLLLCSSYDKGCRPYMCGTSFRYSNCLDQYKKAAAHAPSDPGWPLENCESTELACPLCRGQVKGWTVVDPAREFLNSKERGCMQDGCPFVGTFPELRKHMRAAHPAARPREVDPALEQKWRRLEREREHDDVISTIRSTMPGAMVFGDYVIEGNGNNNNNNYELDSDEENEGIGGDDVAVGFDRNLVNVFLLLHAFGPSGDSLGRRLRQQPDDNIVGVNASSDDENSGNENRDGGLSLASRLRRQRRVLLRQSGRRRRQREQAGGGQV